MRDRFIVNSSVQSGVTRHAFLFIYHGHGVSQLIVCKLFWFKVDKKSSRFTSPSDIQFILNWITHVNLRNYKERFIFTHKENPSKSYFD